VAKIQKDGKHQYELLRAASLCESDPTRANLESARKTIFDADADADVDADAAAAAYAAAAYADAAYAADAAAYAAYAAYAYADAAYADAAAAGMMARNKSLANFCEKVVEILIDMKAPGCQWLWLTEVGAE
jgi:hypothetical protein